MPYHILYKRPNGEWGVFSDESGQLITCEAETEATGRAERLMIQGFCREVKVVQVVTPTATEGEPLGKQMELPGSQEWGGVNSSTFKFPGEIQSFHGGRGWLTRTDIGMARP